MTAVQAIDTKSLWVQSGKTEEEANNRVEATRILKAMKQALNEENTVSTPRSNGENSLGSAQVVQVPAQPAAELKKGKVQKSDEKCKNGLLIASHLPVFGAFSANACKLRIAHQIKSTTETDKITQLKDRLNQYRIASISSILLTLALAVSAVALTAFFLGIASIAFIVGASVAGAVTAAGLALTIYDAVQLARSRKAKEVPVVEAPKVEKAK